MPSDALLKAVNVFHRGVTKLSGGRMGWRGYGMPVVELTTIGRKTGQARTVMLTAPIVDGDTLVVVGSRGGDDTTPAWVHNVRSNPEVRVVTKEGERAMRARVVDPAERAELWERVIRDHPHYAGYQRKTQREIPLVLLEPGP